MICPECDGRGELIYQAEQNRWPVHLVACRCCANTGMIDGRTNPVRPFDDMRKSDYVKAKEKNNERGR